MRWFAIALVAAIQSAPLPPAYPRPGTTKLFENDHVIVWNISWLKQTYPLHRHPYGLIGVYYTAGDRTIVSQAGERRPVHTNAWDTASQDAGVTHIEEGASDAPLRAVFVEIKLPSGEALTDSKAGEAFPAGAGKQLRDDTRGILWEFAPRTPLKRHRHLRDGVAIAFTGQTPHVAFVTKGTVHDDEDVTGTDRLYVVELK